MDDTIETREEIATRFFKQATKVDTIKEIEAVLAEASREEAGVRYLLACKLDKELSLEGDEDLFGAEDLKDMREAIINIRRERENNPDAIDAAEDEGIVEIFAPYIACTRFILANKGDNTSLLIKLFAAKAAGLPQDALPEDHLEALIWTFERIKDAPALLASDKAAEKTAEQLEKLKNLAPARRALKPKKAPGL